MSDQRATSTGVNRFAWLVLLFGLVAAGCTLLTSFDPEGQPCDPAARGNDQCLSDAGYVCVGGVCTRDAGR